MSIAGISSSNRRILSGPLVTNRIHGVGWYSCSSVEGWKNVVLKGCVNCVTTKVIGDAMQAHPERCREYAEWSMCEVHYHYVQGGNLSRR